MGVVAVVAFDGRRFVRLQKSNGSYRRRREFGDEFAFDEEPCAVTVGDKANETGFTGQTIQLLR